MPTDTLSVVIAPERFASFWAEAPDLLAKHWAEIATWPDIPLIPDARRYEALDASGNLVILTARKAGQLIGYAVFIVQPHLHYRSSLQAVQDVLYLDPDERRGRLGLQLVHAADAHLQALGVQVVYQHVKLAHPALGHLVERLGYQPLETIYGKRLDQE